MLDSSPLPIRCAPVLVPAAPYQRDELLHEIFAAMALQRADSPAVRLADVDFEISRKSAWTYADLRARSAQFARYLRARGICRGDRVAMCLPRGLDAYMAILGILEAGAAYVPLDWSFPQERADYVIADCGAIAVVTLSARVDAFATAGARAFAIDANLATSLRRPDVRSRDRKQAPNRTTKRI